MILSFNSKADQNRCVFHCFSKQMDRLDCFKPPFSLEVGGQPPWLQWCHGHEWPGIWPLQERPPPWLQIHLPAPLCKPRRCPLSAAKAGSRSPPMQFLELWNISLKHVWTQSCKQSWEAIFEQKVGMMLKKLAIVSTLQSRLQLTERSHIKSEEFSMGQLNLIWGPIDQPKIAKGCHRNLQLLFPCKYCHCINPEQIQCRQLSTFNFQFARRRLARRIGSYSVLPTNWW